MKKSAGNFSKKNTESNLEIKPIQYCARTPEKRTVVKETPEDHCLEKVVRNGSFMGWQVLVTEAWHTITTVVSVNSDFRLREIMFF